MVVFDAKQRLLKHNLVNNDNIQEQHNFFFEYEAKEYKQSKIIEIINHYIRDYALTKQEIDLGLSHVDARQRIYSYKVNKTKNNKDRISGGMFGEAILYNILKEYFPEAKKMVTKIRKRTTNKMEVNGFDCAHYELTGDTLNLWLGESKLYSSFSGALDDAYGSLVDHLKIEKIKDEFVRLKPDLEIVDQAEKTTVEKFMNGTFDKINFVIPILLTYDSTIHTKHETSASFMASADSHYQAKWHAILLKKFDLINTTIDVKFKFILLPFSNVAAIKSELVQLRDVHAPL